MTDKLAFWMRQSNNLGKTTEQLKNLVAQAFGSGATSLEIRVTSVDVQRLVAAATAIIALDRAIKENPHSVGEEWEIKMQELEEAARAVEAAE